MNRDSMLKTSRILILGAFLLSGCDKVEEFANKQNDLEERIKTLEAEISIIKTKIAEAPKNTDPELSFGECIFKNMRWVNSDLAAVSVKESCLRMVSMPLSPYDLLSLNSSTAALRELGGLNRGTTELYVHLVNNTNYTITELAIIISNKTSHIYSTYTLRWFPEPIPQGDLSIGPPADKTLWMQLPPGQRTFTVEITERTNDVTKFFNEYAWQISGGKGFIK